MISKAQIGLIKSLDQKKYRNQYKVFFVEGIKLVNELLISEFKLHSLFAVKEWVEMNSAIASECKDKINLITEKELKQISNLTAPNQVLAIFEIPDNEVLDLKQSDIILCLEAIRDPGNLGTIIRIADWYGIKNIACSDDCVDAYNPKVVQSSMGSIARVRVDYVDLKSFLSALHGFHTYATTLSGKSIHSIKLEFPAVVIIGNESQGLTREVAEICQHSISIPKYGGAESLNAAMAAGIILDKFKLDSQIKQI
jgi:RNA methyltransferase, TrmH family